MKIIKKLDAILGKISDLCSWVAGAALFFIAALTFVDVFCRYFLRKSITGSQELCQMAMVFVVYFALSYSTRIRAHVRVDVVTNLLPEWLRNIVLGVMTWACIFISANISIRTFRYGFTALNTNLSTTVLGIPHYPFYFIISVMCVLLSLEFFADGVKYIAAGVNILRGRNGNNDNAPEELTQQGGETA